MSISEISPTQLNDIEKLVPNHPVFRAKVKVEGVERNVILKAESRTSSKKQRQEIARNLGQQAQHPKLKQSLLWMAKIHNIASGENGFGEIRILTKGDVWYLKGKLRNFSQEINSEENFWYLMECFDNLEDCSCLQSPEHTTAAKMNKFKKCTQAIANNPEILQTLGAIAAADWFNGNQDRLQLSPRCSINNWGNIFLISNIARGKLYNIKTHHKFIGIDFYDPYNMFKSFNENINQQIGIERWPGEILKDENNQQLKQAVAEIMTCMKNSGVKISTIRKQHETAFLEGVQTAKKNLKEFASAGRTTSTQPGGTRPRREGPPPRPQNRGPRTTAEINNLTPQEWPVGVKSRFQFLGWM